MDMKIIIGASVSHALNAFNTLKAKAAGVATVIKSAFSSVNSILGMAGIGLGIGQLSKYVNRLSDTAKAADNLDLNTDEFQKLSYAAERSGLGTEKLKNGLHNMKKIIGQAKDGNSDLIRSFLLLGITMNDLNGKNTFEQLMMIRNGLDKIADNNLKKHLADKIFSEMGKEFQVFARDVDSLMERAGKISLIDEEDLRNAEKLADMFDDIGSFFQQSITKGVSLAKDALTGDLESDPLFKRRTALRESSDRMGKLDRESRSTYDYKNAMIQRQTLYGMNPESNEFKTAVKRLDDMLGKLKTLQDVRQGQTAAAQFDEELKRQREKIGPMSEDEADKIYSAKNIGELDKAVEDITKARKKAEDDLQNAIKEATTRLGKNAPVPKNDKKALQSAKDKDEVEKIEKAITGRRKIDDEGDELDRRFRQAQMIISGKNRDVAIEDEINKAEKIAKEHGISLTDSQRERITESTGKLFDATKPQMQPTLIQPPQNQVFTDRMLRMGGQIGTIRAQTATTNYDKITAEKITTMEQKIGQIYDKLPTRTELADGGSF